MTERLDPEVKRLRRLSPADLADEAFTHKAAIEAIKEEAIRRGWKTPEGQAGRLCHGNANEHALRAKTRQRSFRCDSTLPLCGGFGSEDPQCGSRDEVALEVEGIVDGGMHAEEALGGSSRLEPLQLALSASHGLMRILRPIVFPEPLLMRTGQSETAERRGVGAQFVGDQQFRREAELSEQLAD
jgi:hypothetical protein